MITLKTNKYEEFFAACDDAGLVNEDGVIITSSANHQLCLIGTLYESTGGALINGYHVNLKTRNGFKTGLEHLAIECANPQYKFAGDK